MAITLEVGATSITLHPDLYWEDEFSWAPVEQSEKRTITGALVISTKSRIAGRPITLRPENEGSGWVKRDVLLQAQAWAATPGQEMTLTLGGAERQVVFRHGDGAITTNPVVHFQDIDGNDFYLATFRFLEIE